MKTNEYIDFVFSPEDIEHIVLEVAEKLAEEMGRPGIKLTVTGRVFVQPEDCSDPGDDDDLIVRGEIQTVALNKKSEKE